MDSQWIELVKDCVSQILEITSKENLDSDAGLEDELGFDSGMFVELLMTIEDKRSDLQIDPVVLQKDDFKTIRSLASYLEVLSKKDLRNVSPIAL